MPQFSLQDVPHYALLFGSLLIAVLCIMFFWGLAGYVFYKGDDQKRTDAKLLVINVSVWLLFVMILWAIIEWI